MAHMRTALLLLLLTTQFASLATMVFFSGMMNVVKWILGITTGLAATGVIVTNWLIFFHNCNPRKAGYISWVPVVGGGIGVASLLLIPIPELKYWWWVPLLLDWGSVPGMALEFFLYLRSRCRVQHDGTGRESQNHGSSTGGDEAD